jgi:repressor LexA
MDGAAVCAAFIEEEPMLTSLEDRMLGFIRSHLADHGHAPTLTEIGAALGLRSKGTVHRYVQSLIDKGRLEQPQRGWRSLQLPARRPAARGATRTLPLLGRIAAGKPIEAIPGQDEIAVDELFQGRGKRFALEVRGDSMIEAGILDGDLVIVESRDSADDGAIVVALIDEEEATLKRLKRRRNGEIELIPANRTMALMIYAADRVRIQGVLVGQMRRY